MMDIGRTGVHPSVMAGHQDNTGGQDVHSRIVDALPGLVWTALPDGQIDFLNQRWCEYTGLGIDKSLGHGWQAAVHPADLPGLLAGWRAVSSPSGPVEAEARLRGSDGTYR